jgi:hypothetical protein
VTDTAVKVRVGQVWQPRQNDHSSMQCVIVGVNNVSARMRALKNHNTNSMGGSSKNRDQFFHRTLDELTAQYVLVKDAAPEESESTERPMSPKESQRKAWADRFDSLSTQDRIEILEARRHRMEQREILRTWDIEPAVLGMLLAWAGDEYPDLLVAIDPPQPVTVTEHAAVQPITPDVPTEAEVVEISAAAAVEPTHIEPLPRSVSIAHASQAEFSVEMLVLQPMKVVRTFTAASYAAVEQIVGSEVDNLVEIIGISKVAH